jgi:hypothetical protein
MHIKLIKNETPLHLHTAYLSGFKRGGRSARQESRGVSNLIYKSLFHYYGDYSTSTFLPSVCSLPSICFPYILS